LDPEGAAAWFMAHIPRQTHQNGKPIEKILQLIAFHFWFS
jgi:hypothetical protein